jgi:hypothetical protein
MNISEIASPATGDANLLARMPRLLQRQHRPVAFGGDAGTH